MTPRRYVAKVDYMACRSQLQPLELLEVLQPMVEWTGHRLTMDEVRAGLHGYQRGAELLLAGARFGRMDWGGDSMRGWVRLDVPGQGCGFIDWSRAAALTMRAELRRCDPCVTFTDGSVTHQMAVEAYRQGLFRDSSRGRPPKCRKVEPEGDPWAGSSMYVGKRGAFKMARCYEKGLEVLAREGRVPAADVDPATVLVDGWPARDLYRIEVEFHAQGRVALPWDMVADPLGYWRGAYPWLASLVPEGPRVPLAAPEKLPTMNDVETALRGIQAQFGRVLYTALIVHGGDIGAVFDKVCGSEHSERLVRAGALLAEMEGAGK